MIISNNIAAQTILNESNRNLKKSSKLAEKLSTGTKITSAGDDAAGYTISERMWVKLRALNQDDNNVKSGKDMLTVASGAVQSQMNILRTIKERVIDANNDTNTDTDRKIIQREIDEYYDQMSIIAYDTDFNGEKLLVGGKVDQVVESWEVYDHAVMAEDSEIPGLLTDAIEGDLDGEPGPFATFGKEKEKVPWDGYNKNDDTPESWAECAASNTNGAHLVGGTRGNSRIIEVDLSSYNIAALDNVSFRVTAGGIIPRDFVLTTDTSRNYQRAEKIDISGCITTDDIAARIKAAVNSVQEISDAYDITVSGAKITFTTKKDGEDTNTEYDITGQNINAADVPINGHSSAPNTGLTLINFSGGKNAVTHTENVKYRDTNDPDLWHDEIKTVVDVPATNATCTINGISNVAAGSGITINGSEETYLIFADDSSSLAYDDIKHCYTIGKNFSGNFSLAGIGFELSGNTLKATAETAGSGGNNFSFTDGITGKADVTIHYTAAQELTGISVTQKGTNGNRAYWDMDLSAYNNTDATKAEELIKKYLGKTIGINSANIEFIDSGSSSGMDALYKITANTIDLNDVRTAVAGGTMAAEAFEKLLEGRLGSSSVKEIKAADGAITGIKFLANKIGEEGNQEEIKSQIGELRHYTIDWQKWVDTQNITDIPAALHEKGIRFYCPTDGSQWVNVRFVNGLTDNDYDRPDSGTDKQDIKTLTIDVAGITDTKSLVEKINDELGDYLANTYNHNLLITSDPASGTTTIYDKRRKTVLNVSGYDRQDKGAKIGTGIMDNVAKSTRNVLVNEVIIQHTDKANMNIHLKIPQTSLDHIFGYKTSMRDISEYNVMTSDMREKLLGVPPKKGILDNGIQYLADAQTLIGAQVNHLEVAKNNIDTQSENLTASESVIRDADMAATMVEFTKYNILGQAAQSMLAQANQLPQRILELLQ